MLVLQRMFCDFRDWSRKHALLTPPTTDAPYVPLRRYGPAALAAATAAWRAGTDVQTALQQAGYAYEVVVGLSQYFSQASVPELELLSQSQPEPEMSSAKRARTSSSSGATTTSAYARRRNPPVAPAVKTYVKGCMDRLLEVKSLTTAVIDTVPGPAGALALVPVEDILAGSGEDSRTGNIIHISKIVFNYVVFDSVPGLMRLIWFIDRQANGTTPTLTNVLTSASFVATYNTLNVIGHGGHRYLILGDETRTLNPGVAAAVQCTTLNTKVISKKIPVHYLASTGAATDVATNNVWCFVIANTATATIRHQCQIQFTDN